MKNIKRKILIALSGMCALTGLNAQSVDYPAISSLEPTVEIAKTWWSEQTNVWTPIGWQNNYLRYTVLYNGALMIDPAHGLMGPRPNSREFVGKDFMLSFSTYADGLPPKIAPRMTNVRNLDYGYGIQGWNRDHETPVLWTEFRIQAGMIVRAEMFAHQKGSGDVETGLEPLYAWVRLKVIWVDPVRKADLYPITIQTSRVYYGQHDEVYRKIENEPSFKIVVLPENAPYKPALKGELYEENGLFGMYITEPDGKVRMAVQPTDSGRLNFFNVSEGVNALNVMMKGEVGDYVDLLVPMFPEEKDFFAEEQAETYDGALTESDWYWKAEKPATAATFKVPEKYITEAIDQSLKFAPVIAEKDHITGEYSYLTGAWGYDCLWPTPTSMVSHMLADQFGYHNYTARYSEIFMQNQGTITAPGHSFYLHPGYYGAPKTLTSIDWLSDHGAILLQIATSGLLSGDKEYIDHWMPSIIAACDYIKDMSAATDHDGVVGLLPPAVAGDDGIVTQAVWNIAWNYKALVTAVKLMISVGHPRAQEFADFAARTKELFQTSYRALSEKGDRWIDDQGRERYRPPTTLSLTSRDTHAFSDIAYLDAGPLVLVWAGLMDADDPIMRDMADFFRYGPNTKYFTPIYNCVWRPSLQHEISTCEPCYSWNAYHSWQLGDKRLFLEAMYSMFVGCMSQNTYISAEHRHGVQGNLFVAPIAGDLAKLAVIDDRLKEGELHLLRLCPNAWISSEEESVFDNMPTEYGPVNMKFRRSADGKALDVSFSAQWRQEPGKIVLHAPQMPGLEKIVVNGAAYSTNGEIIL